jgi:hypothetical protein
MRKFTKKTLAVSTAAALLLGGGAAYAYWTAGGSGTGTAATGTSTPIVAVQTTAPVNMRPGDTAQALSGNFTNADANGPVYVTSVTASITSVTGGGSVGPYVCSADDYTLATPVMTVNAQVPTGTAQGAWTGATIKFNNSSTVNQDNCKGATVNLTYTIL